MDWEKEAQKAIEKVPVFVRKMAKMAVEKAAREKGVDTVTADLVEEVKEKYFSIMNKDKNEKKGPKIAVVRCETVSEVCPGVACFKAFNKRKLKFAGYGADAELIGFFTCGGCSGRRVSRLVDSLLKHDLDVVHMASCMFLDEDYPKCPFRNQIKENIERKGVQVVEGTHH